MGGVGLGGQGRCEQRKIKNVWGGFRFRGGGGGGGGSGGGRVGVGFLGQGGCERRIEVFAKIQKKKNSGGGGGGGGGRVGGGGGVRVDVNEELKFL